MTLGGKGTWAANEETVIKFCDDSNVLKRISFAESPTLTDAPISLCVRLEARGLGTVSKKLFRNSGGAGSVGT